MVEDDYTEATPIYSWLYLGTIRDAVDETFLLMNFIDRIIAFEYKPPHYDFIKSTLFIDIKDSPDENIEKHFNDIHNFLDNAYYSRDHVLVYCRDGVSRAATAVISYIMKNSETYSLNNAFDMVKSARSSISPNIGFMLRLRSYEDRLKRKNKTHCTMCGKEIHTDVLTHLDLCHKDKYVLY